MRKKVDARVRALIENGVRNRHRSIFVVVGDKGREQVVNLHYMLSKAVVKARPSVLWCYKKELQLSSHRKKRMKQIKKLVERGLLDPEKEDPFSLFMASTNIRYCYYHDTAKVLGNTYGMCVLQDFEALTPNLLARTIETVEGGGLVILLLSSLTSLTKLYTLTMDVHARFRTEAHQQVVGRFNERFMLSLGASQTCLMVDDELNVLPICSRTRELTLKRNGASDGEDGSVAAGGIELKELKESLRDTMPVGPLVGCCRTHDQAKAVVTFLDAVSERTLRSTVALTAARGRGKSAAMGVAIAGALAMGYSNIFVTSPSPENLKTLFEFILKGLDSLDYKEHMEYDVVESTNPDFHKALVRLNLYREHRQTVQYIQPQDYQQLAHAELLVIDEAAAIPLPVVKKLLGPYLVFLCSTINGYEGTGRSLSIKLLSQLRKQGVGTAEVNRSSDKTSAKEALVNAGSRTFKEVVLDEPVRYASADPVESWLNGLLCLDAADHIPRITYGLPHPDQCDLYYVNRDTLFSFHGASEAFLHRVMALLVASHYKNTPNDLQLLSDAPAHHLFVLLAPVDEEKNSLPEVLAVIQVSLEGSISKSSAKSALAQGQQPTGDLIPWTISQQFQESSFASLSGARVVRVAVHPELQRGGYGTRALELLRRYYEGEICELDEEEKEAARRAAREEAAAVIRSNNSSVDALVPRRGLPPLLTNLADRPPETLHYLGVSYGLTQDLFNFWSRGGYFPVYLRQTPSETTGEHTCVMIRPLAGTEDLETSSEGLTEKEQRIAHEKAAEWLRPFVADFRQRLLVLLGRSFSHLPTALCLSLINPRLSHTNSIADGDTIRRNGTGVFSNLGTFTSYDLKRLDSYCRNLADYHLILDLVPRLAELFFQGAYYPLSLSYVQAAILVALGLQHRSVESVEKELSLPVSQVLALFNKALRKQQAVLKEREEDGVKGAMPRLIAPDLKPIEQDLDSALREGAQEGMEIMQARQEKLLQPESLAEYALDNRQQDFEEALANDDLKAVANVGVVSLKSKAGASNQDTKDAKGGSSGKSPTKVAKQGKKHKHGGSTPTAKSKRPKV